MKRIPALVAASALLLVAWGPVATGGPRGESSVGSERAFAAISAGSDHTCGLDTVGKAWCWGLGHWGVLGDGGKRRHRTPTAVAMPSGVSFTQIVAGRMNTCALSGDGRAWCWGESAWGENGDGTLGVRLTPGLVSMPPGVSFTDIAIGEATVCTLDADGKAWCWGYGRGGQIGDAGLEHRDVPTAVEMPEGVSFEAIAASGSHVCAIDTFGRGWCWGGGYAGALGDGGWLETPNERADRRIPTKVDLPRGVRLSRISLGDYFTCALAIDGVAWCWGMNPFGLGTGWRNSWSPTPTPVVMPAGVRFVDISTRWQHTCALAADGSAWCWGMARWGAIGDGSSKKIVAVPRQVRAPVGVRFADVSAGLTHTCAVDTVGGAWCWGENWSGKLGTGGRHGRLVPGRVRAPWA